MWHRVRKYLVPHCVFILTSGLAGGLALAQAPELSLPIECRLGTDCFVQNYVDLDPGEGVRTAGCGFAGYDGHKGTDFRLLTTEDTAPVVAAAPGVVSGVRDGMVDRLVLSRDGQARIEGRECGNGVVIDHGGGWETQYCHMRNGSLIVSAGDRVRRGQKLGEVGYSGFAAFAHVHLSVRRNGEVVDPFLGPDISPGTYLKACAAHPDSRVLPAEPLWLTDAGSLLADAGGTLIQSGFADGPVGTADLERGRIVAPGKTSAALVFFARFINLQKGDRAALRVRGPQGFLADAAGEPVDRNKAQWVAFAGRKLRADQWPPGEYIGEVVLIRNDDVILREESRFRLADQAKDP